MCKYIFQCNYIYIFDDSISAMHLYSSRWHCLINNDDVMFHSRNQILNVLWKCAMTMKAKVKPSAQI